MALQPPRLKRGVLWLLAGGSSGTTTMEVDEEGPHRGTGNGFEQFGLPPPPPEDDSDLDDEEEVEVKGRPMMEAGEDVEAANDKGFEQFNLPPPPPEDDSDLDEEEDEDEDEDDEDDDDDDDYDPETLEVMPAATPAAKETIEDHPMEEAEEEPTSLPPPPPKGGPDIVDEEMEDCVGGAEEEEEIAQPDIDGEGDVNMSGGPDADGQGPRPSSYPPTLPSRFQGRPEQEKPPKRKAKVVPAPHQLRDPRKKRRLDTIFVEDDPVPAEEDDPMSEPDSPGGSQNLQDMERNMKDRWMKLRDAREEERSRAIRDGLMADPNRPTTLENAVKPRGICEDMCPRYERAERIFQKTVDRCERRQIDNGSLPDERLMVKKFRRSAAGVDEQVPSDLRTPRALKASTDYLIDQVIGRNESSFASVHKFVWDRTRAIRNDITIQQFTEPADVKIAVYCLERIARFHILALHLLAHVDDDEDFNVYQEREQLNSTLVTLRNIYDDNYGKLEFENEPEIRAYSIILDETQSLEEQVQGYMGRERLLRNPQILIALDLRRKKDDIFRARGPLVPYARPNIAQEDPGSFFAVVKHDSVHYLMACVAEIFFNQLRLLALRILLKAHRRTQFPWPLEDLMHALGDDDAQVTLEFARANGYVFREDLGKYFINIQESMIVPDENADRAQAFSDTIVELKRNNMTLPEIIHRVHVKDSKAFLEHGRATNAGNRLSSFTSTIAGPSGTRSTTSTAPFSTLTGTNHAPSSSSSFPPSFPPFAQNGQVKTQPSAPLTSQQGAASLFSLPTPVVPANENPFMAKMNGTATTSGSNISPSTTTQPLIPQKDNTSLSKNGNAVANDLDEKASTSHPPSDPSSISKPTPKRVTFADSVDSADTKRSGTVPPAINTGKPKNPATSIFATSTSSPSLLGSAIPSNSSVLNGSATSTLQGPTFSWSNQSSADASRLKTPHSTESDKSTTTNLKSLMAGVDEEYKKETSSPSTHAPKQPTSIFSQAATSAPFQPAQASSPQPPSIFTQTAAPTSSQPTQGVSPKPSFVFAQPSSSTTSRSAQQSTVFQTAPTITPSQPAQDSVQQPPSTSSNPVDSTLSRPPQGDVSQPSVSITQQTSSAGPSSSLSTLAAPQEPALKQPQAHPEPPLSSHRQTELEPRYASASRSVKSPAEIKKQKDEALQHVAEKYILQQRTGALDRFIEDKADPIIREVMREVFNEQIAARKLLVRRRYLAKKYGALWRRKAAILHRKRTSRDFRARMKELREKGFQKRMDDIEQLKTYALGDTPTYNLPRGGSHTPPHHMTYYHASPSGGKQSEVTIAPTTSRKRKSGAGAESISKSTQMVELTEPRKKRKSEGAMTEAVGKRTRDHVPPTKPTPNQKSSEVTPAEQAAMLRKVRSAFQNGDSGSHKRSKTTTNIHEVQDIRELDPRYYQMPNGRWRKRVPNPWAQNRKVDRTKTDYFKCIALGIDPNTPMIPPSYKSLDKKNAKKRDREEGSAAQEERKKYLKVSAKERRVSGSEPINGAVEDIIEENSPTPPLSPEPAPKQWSIEDEPLLMESRRLAAALAEEEALLRAERLELEREGSDRSPSSTHKLKNLRNGVMETSTEQRGKSSVSGRFVPTISRTEARIARTGAHGLAYKPVHVLGNSVTRSSSQQLEEAGPSFTDDDAYEDDEVNYQESLEDSGYDQQVNAVETPSGPGNSADDALVLSD